MATSETRRDLLLAAMIHVVGAKGYKATSVADVIEEAGVARATFYKYFEDKHECFLAAYDQVVEQVMAQVTADCDPGRPWLQRVETGLANLVQFLALDPELARMAVIEVAAAGGDARRRHWDAVANFTRYLEDGRSPTDKDLPESTSLMSAGAVAGLIFDELLAGRAEQLPEMLPDLLFAMLVPYVGPHAAAEEMRRVAAAG